MKDLVQTNVFAWIWIVFAHFIIGCVTCAIRYPVIGKLYYTFNEHLMHNLLDPKGLVSSKALQSTIAATSTKVTRVVSK